MKFVKRKATTAISKQTAANFANPKLSFLEDVVTTVEMEEIPPELIMNWDQTGIKIVPCSTWTMERQGSKRVERSVSVKKRKITAAFCGTSFRGFSSCTVGIQGKDIPLPPSFRVPTRMAHHTLPQALVHRTDQGVVRGVILPYVEQVRASLREDKAALVIMDNFKGQITEDVNSLLDTNNIHVCLLPLNTTDSLQPMDIMDIAVNKPAKVYLKRIFDEWYSEQVLKQLQEQDTDYLGTVDLQPINLGLPALKEIGAQWLVDMASYISDNPQFIVNGFRHSGIIPTLNGQEVTEESKDEQETDSDCNSDESEGE